MSGKISDHAASHNLLIDSLSSDSDVPDLQLVPPAKTKRKLRLKSKLSAASASFANKVSKTKVPPNLPSTFAQQPNQGHPASNCSCCLGFLFFALTAAVVALALFSVSMYRELTALKFTVNLNYGPPVPLYIMNRSDILPNDKLFGSASSKNNELLPFDTNSHSAVVSENHTTYFVYLNRTMSDLSKITAELKLHINELNATHLADFDRIHNEMVFLRDNLTQFQG